MTHIEFLKSLCELEGVPVVDIGAGDGVYSRQLNAEGAKVTAIEVDPKKVAKIEHQLPEAIEVKLGAAEALPLDSGSQDLACMFFSLHHVPAAVQSSAFDEIQRVLSATGRLHVVEPYPFGTMFDVVRIIEDETIVRTKSHKILKKLQAGRALKLVQAKEYVLTREYPTFEIFCEKIVRSDPDRKLAFNAVAEEMEKTFNQVLETVNGRSVLHQPCAAYHFVFES